jgi:hypothetical protein
MRAADDREAWIALGDSICELLSVVYRDEPERFREAARKNGASVESLAAAAICEMLAQEWGVRPQRAPASRIVENRGRARKKV